MKPVSVILLELSESAEEWWMNTPNNHSLKKTSPVIPLICKIKDCIMK